MKVCGQKMGGGGGRGVPAKLLTVHCQMPLLSFLVSCAAAANEIQQCPKRPRKGWLTSLTRRVRPGIG